MLRRCGWMHEYLKCRHRRRSCCGSDRNRELHCYAIPGIYQRHSDRYGIHGIQFEYLGLYNSTYEQLFRYCTGTRSNSAGFHYYEHSEPVRTPQHQLRLWHERHRAYVVTVTCGEWMYQLLLL